MRLFALVLALLAANCGSFEQMSAVKQDTDRAADALERDLGARPEIGFNIFNGELATVTVVIDSARVQGLQVSDLEGRVHRALASALKVRPQAILVSLRSTILRTGQAAQNAPAVARAQGRRPAV